MTDEVFIGTVNESPKPFIKQVDTVKELSCSRANVFACLSGSIAIRILGSDFLQFYILPFVCLPILLR